MAEEDTLSREYITGRIILFCVGVLLITIIGIRILNVSVSNIEYIDRGLFTIITSKGTFNVTPDDVVRIERSYSQAAFTGKQVELNTIYTKEGFIYFSSLDPFYLVGEQLIRSVHQENLTTWEHPLLDYSAISHYTYALGMPIPLIPLFFVLRSLQYFSLIIAGIALLILVFPIRTTIFAKNQ